MNWQTIISDLRAHGLTFETIGAHVGVSKGAVHDLFSGRAREAMWGTGDKLLALHKKYKRRKLPGHAQKVAS